MPRRAPYRTGHDEVDDGIARLVERAGIGANADLVAEMLVSAIRMGREDADRGDLKLVNAALKELRYSFLVFQPYQDVPKVSIFGSARTTHDDPNYAMARDFARAMAEHEWMVITGAGPGIMEAGIEGAGADMAFGVNIVLPFESAATPLILGDPKLINYRYFFTRKLTFMKESRAFALLPGGFGTMDEGFELLTLMQTGRSPIAPVVLLDEPGSTYWLSWLEFVKAELGARRLISDDDFHFVKITQDIDEAVDEICGFYTTFHSMRYVGRRLIMRLNRDLTDAELTELDRDFGDITVSGTFERVGATPSEVEDDDVPDLPRLAFRFDRMSYARLRRLIDRINGRG